MPSRQCRRYSAPRKRRGIVRRLKERQFSIECCVLKYERIKIPSCCVKRIKTVSTTDIYDKIKHLNNTESL